MEPNTINQENDFRTRAEQQANRVALANAGMSNAITLLEKTLAGVKDAHHGPVHQAIQAFRTAKADLLALVEANPGEFKKPKSLEFNNVSFGLRKGQGRLEFADDESAVIARIRAQRNKAMKQKTPEGMSLAGRLGACILVKQTVSKEALELLPAKTLEALGVIVADTGDKAFVTVKDTPEKRAAKLLGALSESETKEGQ